MRRAQAILTALFLANGAHAQDAPRRIVSFNLCADQLVVALADPAQIAGLSPYAADANLSVVAAQAAPFRRVGWQAEATLALMPDLVLIGPNDRPLTRRILQAQNLRVAEVALVTDIDAARAQIAEVAALLGHTDRGGAMIAALDAARARLRASRTQTATALVIERGGYTQGPQSLVAALLEEAGLRPPPDAPRGYGGFLSLERLLMLRPDVVFLKDPPASPGDQGALYLTHPALRAVYRDNTRVALPTRYTLCGGPALIAAMDYLAGELAKLPR